MDRERDRLACYAMLVVGSTRMEYDLFRVELSKSYGMMEWREDLKKVMMKAGLENIPIVFLFSDTQVRPSRLYQLREVPPGQATAVLINQLLIGRCFAVKLEFLIPVNVRATHDAIRMACCHLANRLALT